MIKDSRSYETQIIDAVRSVNRALGGTYGTSSAIYRNEFNQYEVQLIDAIKGIARTLSGSGLSLAGGGSADLSGYVTQKEFQSLSARVTKLEAESFFRLVDGNVTLKSDYQNLWVPGWLAAGGVGTGGGGGAILLSQLEDVSIDTTTLADGHVLTWDASAGTAGLWVNKPASGGGGGGGTVTSITLTSGNGITVSNSGVAITTSGSRTISISSATLQKIEHGEDAYGWGNHANAGYATQTWVQNQNYLVSGSLYTLRTAVSSTAANGTLLGVDALSNASSSAAGSDTSRIAWDSANSAWHVYGNLYADGWVAAGGVGSGGGGGGGASNLYQLDDVSLTSLSSNQFLYYDNGYWKNTSLKTINNNSIIGSGNITISSGGGGSVTSVALSVPTGLSVSGSPITSSGTITISFASGYSIPTDTKQGQWDTAYTLLTGSQAKNKVFASPANASGAPSFRALVFDDIPDLSSKYVTLDTTQTISGAKTFSTNPVTIDSTSYLSVNSSSYIDIGDARLEYDSGSYALRITKRSGTSQTIGLYADGFVAAGGVAASASRNIVFTDGNQSVDGEKTFTGRTVFSGTNLGDASYGIDAQCDSKFTNIYATGNATISTRVGIGGSPNNAYALYVTGSQYNSGGLTIGGSATITSGLGVGTAWTGGANKLVVSGSAIATAWNTSSDRRLKDDIEDLSPEYAIGKLMSLKPSVWTWNSGLAQGKKASGFIAQDVENIIPYMVSGEEYKSMNYQMLHAYEVSAIQSHERRIAELERENEMLKERLNVVR